MSSNEVTSKKKSSIARVFFCIIFGIVTLLLIAILFTTIMTRSNMEPPTIFGYGLCISTSDSVDGTVKSGSLVIIKEIEPSTLKVGDTITYKGGYDLQKRVMLKTDTIVSIKDDNYFIETNNKNDKGINKKDVIGKVSVAIPAIGGLFLFIKTPIGLILCVAVPLFILLIFEIINLIKLSKNQDEKDKAMDGDLPSYMQINIEEKPLDIFGDLTPKKDSSDILINDNLFEQQDEKLELVELRSPFSTLSYKKSNVVETEVNTNSIYSTREFQLPDIEKETPIENPPLPKTNVTTLTYKTTDFSASINTDTTNNFNIEGISVNVEHDAVKLKIDNDTISRDIDITVTNEYTNVVVNSDDYEVNFAFLKHQIDKEQKVIIQKKSKG